MFITHTQYDMLAIVRARVCDQGFARHARGVGLVAAWSPRFRAGWWWCVCVVVVVFVVVHVSCRPLSLPPPCPIVAL